MQTISAALCAGLLHGAALAAGMTVIILVSLRHDPEVWLSDYPPAIRAAYGREKSPRARARGLGWSLAALVLLVAVHASLFGRLAAAGDMSFDSAFIAAYVCFSVFNLVDLLVIDLAIMIGLRPRWAILPGTDPDHPAYRDVRFHVRNFAIGCAMGVPFAAVAAAIGWLLLG